LALPDSDASRRRFERLSNVREVVFGMQDGVLTTAGVLAGLSGAVANHSQVVLAALASTVAGALSMGVGAYLGTHAEREVLRTELDRAGKEIRRNPYIAQEELLRELEKEGLSREAGYRVVKLLSTAPGLLVSTTEEKVFGIGGAMLGNPILDGVVMGVAFVAGALVPLAPFVFIAEPRVDLFAALGATAIALYSVGYYEGWLADRQRRWQSGLRFLAIAMGAAAIGYLIGLLISPLGGSAG